MTTNRCSPNVNSKRNVFTCFEDQELREIALAFNIWIQTNKVLNFCSNGVCVPTNLIAIENKTPKQLWGSIYNRLKRVCPNESCWTSQEFIQKIRDKNLREKIQYFTFKPKFSGKGYSWLSTRDINSVVKQYEKVYPHFKFLGALPSDFYKLVNVRYQQFKNTKFLQIAIVFNLDTHDQPGSHWVTLFIDNKLKTVEYFDSVGDKPNKNIKRFLRVLMEHLNEYVYLQNKTVHQKQNSECGVYAIYYIIQRLKGARFHKKITDAEMKSFRRCIFN